ncbi:MAG: aminotransferase class I/II-fold pyridoxal phosphate-dependent enzyme [Cyclobacteriaceae bacterium]
MNHSKIYLSAPDIGEEERKLVFETLDSGWLAPAGPQIDLFETSLQDYLGANYVLAVNSGTSAIHLGLRALGVKEGDYVLCPTFAFCAVVNPILYEKAIPVLIDCERDTWGIDPSLLEESIKDLKAQHIRPKAIILVHSYGSPGQLDEVLRIAGTYEIPILEDAAEAFGSNYNGRLLGNCGDIGILSFNGNKIVTTGGGGALILKTEDMHKKALKWATQSKDEKPYYHHSELGFNYRMSSVAAAIGQGQLEQLGNKIKKKKTIFDYYQSRLNHTGVEFFRPYEGSNFWMTCVKVNSTMVGCTNLDIYYHLIKNGIESRLVWQPLHNQPLYNSYPKKLSGVAEELFKQGLCLPSGTGLSELELDRVIETIIERITL